MKEHVIADFHSGVIGGREPVNLSEVIKDVKGAGENLVYWPVDIIVNILEEFSVMLLDRRLPLHNKFPNSGLAYIAGWCRKSNLISNLENTFPNRHMLDRYIPSDTRPDRAYRVFPKGLVAHWMAGNVPTLSFLSVIQGVLTKNANIIKVASISDNLLSELLSVLSSVRAGKSYSGGELVRSIAVIRYDQSQRELGATISRQADARIFWGGDESVAEMRNFPAKLHSSDLVFSNKTSLMVIDEDSFNNMDMEVVARRVAIDISVFEQKACASPHTLFLETQAPSDIEKFALCLKNALTKTLASIPKMIPSQEEISAVLNLRAQYDMFHQAWYSDGTEYTIFSDDLFQLGPPIGNRTLFIRTIDNLERVAGLITPQVQSVGILAEIEKFKRLTDLFAEKGAQRFMNIGTMTSFELPWDGYMISHYLVRWASRPLKK